MLSRLKLKRDAKLASLVPEPSETSARAWDILGNSQVRHPDQTTAPAPQAVESSVPGDLGRTTPDHAMTIHALFKAMISRDPTSEEVCHYERFFEAQDAPGGIQASLQTLLDSLEFKQRIRPAVEAATLDTAALADAVPMRHAVSLGTHCYASWLLQDMGLRRYSSPFDWLYSSPKLVAHCLEDDFTTLLDRAHHEQWGPHAQALHRFYHHGFDTEAAPDGHVPLFFHHNPVADEDHAKLVRSVERLRRLLDSTDTKLFFLLIAGNRPHKDLTPAIENLAAKLDARTKNATLLAVVHSSVTDQASSHSARLWQRGPHSLHALHSSSNMVEGLSFAHQFDNLLVKRLIYQHRFDLAPIP